MKMDDNPQQLDDTIRWHCHPNFQLSDTQEPGKMLMQWEEGEGEDGQFSAKVEGARAILEAIGSGGIDPLNIVRRYLAYTKMLHPDWLGDMSLSTIARLGGDGGKATVSARVKNIREKANLSKWSSLMKCGFERVGNYSAPQIGNTNRKKTRKNEKSKKP